MQTKSTRARALEQRMVDAAVDVIETTREAPLSFDNQVIIKQMIRAITSVGANYAEANNAASRLDFRHKIFIAKKEAAEARYWLVLFQRVNPKIEVSDLTGEVTELLLILQKIITTLDAER